MRDINKEVIDKLRSTEGSVSVSGGVLTWADGTTATLRAKFHTLRIRGLRWTQRQTGNTYCTASVSIDGEHAFKTAPRGGYGDHYRTEAMDELERRGLLPEPRETPHESDWRYCERLGISLEYSVQDVTRERDL